MMAGGIKIKEEKMNKIAIALTLIPSLAFSLTDAQKDMFMKENQKILEKKGLMTPDSGVQIVPRSTLMSADWQKQKDIIDAKQQKKIGYVKEDSPRAHELLHFNEFIQKRAAIETKMFKPTETHLRKHTDEMVMAYTYVGVPKSEMSEYIGIAPAGTYVNKNPNSGWSGAVQFFKNPIGTCAYTENNLHISHGAARIAEEDALSEVNGKITLIDIAGTDASGYLYRVKWFDNNYIRELECANSKYSSDLTKSTIALAKRIDSN